MKNCEKYAKAIAHDILCAQNEGNSDVLFNHMPGGEDIFGRYDCRYDCRYDEKELLDIADWLLEDAAGEEGKPEEDAERKYIVKVGNLFIGEERYFGWLGANRVLLREGFIVTDDLLKAVPVAEHKVPSIREIFGSFGEIELFRYFES